VRGFGVGAGRVVGAAEDVVGEEHSVGLILEGGLAGLGSSRKSPATESTHQ
jgi:hypothetical protein